MPVAFATESGKAAGQRSALARNRSPIAQLAEMQEALRKDVLDPETTPAERAQLMRAYCEGEKLKRVIRGLPANTSQSIRSDTPKRVKAQSQPVLETLPEEPTVKPAIEPSIEPK